ncbi:VWA domain-containing protein [Nocardia sp. NPDC058176]|uniref:vWA domain-containing protein n=1 Tax=Nocardia sp. NPDC058176 TaxID=3346368 RepID=UPI0036D92046
MRFAKIIGLVGVLGLLAAPALAQTAPENSPYAPTMLVLDASGSMLAADPGGGTKMDAAKSAVRGFVDTAPAQAQVGLSVYGTGTGSTDAEKDAGCRDVSVLRAPETIDRAALTTAVDGITPSGYTPIGTALRTAAAELPTEGPRSIVLVSDGLDTCAPPDPCEVARELSGNGAEIVVHAIGFGVDEPSRVQLTCIAETTGGTYTDAADGKALEQVLPRVSKAALRDYASAGESVTGTASYQDAPVLAAGQYLDTIEQRQRRHYAVEIPDGATAYFAGTVSFPRGENNPLSNNSIQLRVFGADGKDCNAFEFEQATRSTDGVALTVAKEWKGATEAGGTDTCKGGGRYHFTLEWSGVADGAPESLPLELNVAVEPGVTDAGPAANPAPVTFAEPGGPSTPVTGGGSFNVATELGGSGVYTDTLQRGEFVFYKVKVDWGQGLAYRVRYLETPGRGIEHVSIVDTTLYNPHRKELDRAFTTYTGTATTLPANEPALATPEARYRNRESSSPDVAAVATAGWYYVAVKLAPAKDDAVAGPVPIELDLTVTGTPEPGPSYRIAPAEPTGEHRADAATGGASTDDDDGGTFVVVGVAVGALLLLGVVGVVITLRRRRTRR